MFYGYIALSLDIQKNRRILSTNMILHVFTGRAHKLHNLMIFLHVMLISFIGIGIGIGIGI